jgi:hypothetical protein
MMSFSMSDGPPNPSAPVVRDSKAHAPFKAYHEALSEQAEPIASRLLEFDDGDCQRFGATPYPEEVARQEFALRGHGANSMSTNGSQQ